jgi:putative flippase GtrA
MRNLFVRFGKFGSVGVLGVFVNLGFYALFRDQFGIKDFFAKSIAIEISILNNFLFNYFWTWSDRGRSLKSFWSRIIRYHGSTFIASFVVTIGVSYLAEFAVALVNWVSFVSLFHIKINFIQNISQATWVSYISYIIGIVAGMIVNFALSDKWVFNINKQQDSTTK